jgi:hypothetical protein
VRRPASFTVLFALTIGAFLAENLLYFPLSVPYMKDLAGGMPLLDMRPGYTPDAVYHLFDVLGPPGRGSYLRLLWTVDLVLPLLFGLSFSSAIRRGGFRAWRAIPLLGSACDYAENIVITILLVRYPRHETVLAEFSSILTLAKFVFYTSGIFLALAGVFARSRKTAPGWDVTMRRSI